MHRRRSGHQRDLRGRELNENPPPATSVTPVTAASVILLRPAPGGFDVFMVRRHIKSDFAADVYVFPGGKAGPEDEVGEQLVDMPTTHVPNAGLEPAIGWTALYMAAIRELFEECGILLASRHDGSRLAAYEEAYEGHRQAVRAGDVTLEELAALERLKYSASELRLFSNWVTPEILTKRFDTFFFVAKMPENQTARHTDLHELTDSMWLTPSSALDKFHAGDFPLVFATERHLERLAQFESIAAIWQETQTVPVPTVRPRPIQRDGVRAFVIPGDIGYEVETV